MAGAGSLDHYREKRRPGHTPEPLPEVAGRQPGERATPARGTPRFVIQEHHATSLHWDFRLERDGVLVSWALPKGLPVDPGHNHLAVHTEDHPLEYATFEGTIPAGEYGGGAVTIWDHGTYVCETWTPREVKVVLHGTATAGRFALFPTKGKNWMIHRMDPLPEGLEAMPDRLSPMLAMRGDLPGDDSGWAYEFKWDGIRAMARVDGGRVHLVSRNGHDITALVPELRAMGEALGSHRVLLDGELVALDDRGRPSFGTLQRRLHVGSAPPARGSQVEPVSFIVFDLLHLDGRSLLRCTYDQRRRLLEQLSLTGPNWAPTPSFVDERGADVLRTAADTGMEGVVAKRRASHYRPGARVGDWVKVKNERTQEVVIGGWTPGNGARRDHFGALLLGLPADGPKPSLQFVGKVGTGFDVRSMETLLRRFRPLTRATSPFDPPVPGPVAKGATWLRPSIIGEVRFTEWTADGRLRHPVWRGVRIDKDAKDVVREQ